MPQKHSDGSMKKDYEAVRSELLFCLLIMSYLSLPGIQQNLSVGLKKSEGRLMEDDEVNGRRRGVGPSLPASLGKEHT